MSSLHSYQQNLTPSGQNLLERSGSYTPSRQYEEVIRKYQAEGVLLQQRSTLAVNQGIVNQSSLSQSASYVPVTYNSGTYNIQQQNQPIYQTVSYQQSGYPNLNEDNIYQFSKNNNIQVREVMSPQISQYVSTEEGVFDRVKRTKKTADVKAVEQAYTTTTTTYNSKNLGVTDYQPLTFSQTAYEIQPLPPVESRSVKTKVVILENPENVIAQRTTTSQLVQKVSVNEIDMIEDQKITLCNIF